MSHDFSGNGHVPVQLTNRICCVTFYLYQKFCSSCALDVTLGHVVIFWIIILLIVPPCFSLFCCLTAKTGIKCKWEHFNCELKNQFRCSGWHRTCLTSIHSVRMRNNQTAGVTPHQILAAMHSFVVYSSNKTNKTFSSVPPCRWEIFPKMSWKCSCGSSSCSQNLVFNFSQLRADLVLDVQLIFVCVCVCRSGGRRRQRRSSGLLHKSFSEDHPAVSTHSHTLTQMPSPFTFLTALLPPLPPSPIPPSFCFSLRWPLVSSLFLSLLTHTHAHSPSRSHPYRQFSLSQRTITCVFEGGNHPSTPVRFFSLGLITHGRTIRWFSALPTLGNICTDLSWWEYWQ